MSLNMMHDGAEINDALNDLNDVDALKSVGINDNALTDVDIIDVDVFIHDE